MLTPHLPNKMEIFSNICSAEILSDDTTLVTQSRLCTRLNKEHIVNRYYQTKVKETHRLFPP